MNNNNDNTNYNSKFKVGDFVTVINEEAIDGAIEFCFYEFGEYEVTKIHEKSGIFIKNDEEIELYLSTPELKYIRKVNEYKVGDTVSILDEILIGNISSSGFELFGIYDVKIVSGDSIFIEGMNGQMMLIHSHNMEHISPVTFVENDEIELELDDLDDSDCVFSEDKTEQSSVIPLERGIAYNSAQGTEEFRVFRPTHMNSETLQGIEIFISELEKNNAKNEIDRMLELGHYDKIKGLTELISS